MSMRLRMMALASGVASIEIDDVIDRYSSVSAKSMRDVLARSKDAKTLNVNIHSDGGEVIEGLAVYNMLKAHPARKVVSIGGIAASMASVIAMAGDEIIMPENSWMMIHNPWGGACGESDDMRRVADVLDGMRDQLANIYAARTAQPVADVLAAMAKETWMTAAEALALGYCTAVSAPNKIAARLDARRFVNAPKALQRAKPKGQTMDPQLLAALGLPDDATLEDVLAAIKVLQDAANPGGDDDAPPSDSDDDAPPGDDKDAKAVRAALRLAAANVNKQLLARIDRLEKGNDDTAKQTLIAANSRKFTPATEKLAMSWPVAAVRAFIKEAPDLHSETEEEPELPRGNRRGAQKPEDITLTPADLEVCKATGRKPADFLAAKKAQALNG